MSERAKTLAEAAGFVLIVTGVALWSISLALVVAGAGLVAVGNMPKRGR